MRSWLHFIFQERVVHSKPVTPESELFGWVNVNMNLAESFADDRKRYGLRIAAKNALTAAAWRVRDYRKALRADLHAALFGAWSGDGEWYLTLRQRRFYRLKCALCLLLGREPDISLSCLGDHVTITYTRGGSFTSPGEPTTHWFEALVVGHGVLSNWWATTYSDSD